MYAHLISRSEGVRSYIERLVRVDMAGGVAISTDNRPDRHWPRPDYTYRLHKGDSDDVD